MFYVGTSGYMYKHWNNGVFYPPRVKDRLSHYFKHLNTLEINSSFYNIPRPQTVERWAASVPTNIPVILKAPRSVTHHRRLRLRFNGKMRAEMLPCSETSRQGVDLLEYFIEGLLMMPKENRGPVLVQLPETMQIDLKALHSVLAMFYSYNLQVALEIRHVSWFQEDTLRLLEKFNSSLVASDWRAFKTPLIVTSNFVYVRRHGPQQMYTGLYSDEQLGEDLDMLHRLCTGSKVFVLFNNDDQGFAPRNAMRMLEMYSQNKLE